ncbi:type II toxin-antitoxin system VapC family toxin [candidate division KSB1 bacterium]|nr:type II toxin-antitoxin system VapC family toxin [candidate division KSB1 bacterium]
MKKPLFIDTSYILALVNTRDEFHLQAKNVADQVDDKLITTEAVLMEVGNALAKPQWREIAVETLEDMRNDDDVEILSVDSELFSKALKFYSSRIDKEWGLTDCISFVVMKDRKLKDALTSDHHFEQAGFQALLRGVKLDDSSSSQS